jgi:CP family cyanate transporter-like MFS transporter
MTDNLSTRPLAHHRLRIIETDAATAALARPALSLVATVLDKVIDVTGGHR